MKSRRFPIRNTIFIIVVLLIGLPIILLTVLSMQISSSAIIDTIKNELWDPYDYPNLDRDIWEKQTIEEIKIRGQILKHLEEQIREVKKHIKKLNKEQNERNNTKQFTRGN